ncbi:S41 family peptidase [Flavobacterium amniphilum]|uniref:S41 family peptidase n=1 Tax=Flavobacterium amniphilum TaxID=1834035 RepID=UPI002029E4D2|nr:S41 family peptidase [Flavobacterium amniphilum]MCL9804866.1 S41 family peptidase [Flavobacterium amniphilum]
MKIDKVYLPLLIFSAVAVGFLLGGIFIKAPVAPQIVTQNETKQKLNKLIDFIDSEYVDDVNTDSIVDQTVTGILEKLDPHSIYIAKNDAATEAQNMRGDFVGIGVNFFIENDTVTVISPIKDGPAYKAGIKAGDRILTAGKKQLFGKKVNTEKLYDILKGEIDSKVNVTVYRKSEKKKLNFEITRNVIPVKSVDIAIMLNKNTGYIKINRFAETTFEEFKKGLTQIINSKANSLVLDLRDNGGGYLEEAVEIADEFLKEKKLIVFTKNKKGRIDKTFATNDGTFENGKITVLINENSASASEIIAGAIQDNDRGLVIGRRSFGKGLVQREMPFKDGSSVRLTVARYYTPTGRSIQKPYNHGSEEYFNDFMNRYHNGELYAKDSIKIADTLKFKTPKGRIVYGGGGIVPDVFVPLEASKGNEVIPILMQSGVVTNFAFKSIDAKRKEFEKMNYSQIYSKVNGTDEYFNLFKEFVAKTDGYIDLSLSKSYVKRYLTAEFCRQLLGDTDYFRIILKEDTMIKEALKH